MGGKRFVNLKLGMDRGVVPTAGSREAETSDMGPPLAPPPHCWHLSPCEAPQTAHCSMGGAGRKLVQAHPKQPVGLSARPSRPVALPTPRVVPPRTAAAEKTLRNPG